MLSSPFDISGLWDGWLQTAAPYLSEYGGIAGITVFLAVTVRAGLKILGGKPSAAKQPSAPSVPDVSDSRSDGEGAGNSGGGDRTAEKTNDRQTEKDAEQKRAQEQLKELFALFDEGKDRPQENQKTAEDKELEELGLERPDLQKLREKYADLAAEIAALIERGANAGQTAKALIGRTVEQIPVMELRPLIEAIECFLLKNADREKDTAVIGVDPLFEQHAALSALKRGDYETAVGFLERRAEAELHKAESSHRADVRAPAEERAAVLYRAAGVLSRPYDAKKSFDSLKKSKECDAENTLTDALLARAYYESGKTAKAESMFENIARDAGRDDYAGAYAAQTLAEIRTAEVMRQARRIRENYEQRLEETEGRRLVSERDLAVSRKAEINRANARRGIRDDRMERDGERERA